MVTAFSEVTFAGGSHEVALGVSGEGVRTEEGWHIFPNPDPAKVRACLVTGLPSAKRLGSTPAPKSWEAPQCRKSWVLPSTEKLGNTPVPKKLQAEIIIWCPLEIYRFVL